VWIACNGILNPCRNKSRHGGEVNSLTLREGGHLRGVLRRKTGSSETPSSYRAVVPGGRRSLPLQFHSPFSVGLRLADDSGSSGHEVGSRLTFDSLRKGSSVESKLYSSFPYSALAALKMEMPGSASFQSAKNCLYRVRARTWAASATAPVDFSIPRHWREPDLAVLALPRGYPHNCWLSARSLLKGSSLKGSSGTLHQQIHALAADDRAYNTR
jgi:hypothetical protein